MPTLARAGVVALALLVCTGCEKRPGVKANLHGAADDIDIVQREDGSLLYRLYTPHGVRELTPEQFTRKVWEEQRKRSLWMLLLNISSVGGVAWVALGLGGQVLFTGRMIVQLFASEKSRRSTIPTSFWWMSLIGATMLIVYFLWRKDPVGVLGQSIGWVVYVRNLHLIYSHKTPPAQVHDTEPVVQELEVQ